MIFDDKGYLIGVIYDGIEMSLNYEESNEFWSNFGFSIRDSKDNIFKTQELEEIGDPAIFEGYKPKRGGCKANNRWVCVIRDY